MSDERLPDLFEEAAALDAQGRRRLLDRLRREDPPLAEELARLLAAPETALSPIDAPPPLPAADVRETEAPPARVGPYHLLREIGRGGMGRVFLAEEVTEDFRRTVALKLIHSPGPDEDAVRRFRAEVRILAALEHPGIARFLGGGRSPEGIWFLALEYVDGKSLLEHAREFALSVRERVELFVAVVEAVAYAHGRGVVHRDLKPSNVMVGSDGRPRLLDFGISRVVDGEAAGLSVTHTDWHPLTPAYASPEQFRGERVSPRSDTYSLGVMLYELLAGRRPFDAAGESRFALERAVLDSDPEPPSTASRRARRRDTDPADATPSGDGRAEIDPDLDAICLKALRRDADERYGDAQALGEDLRRYLEGVTVEARAALRTTLARALSRRRRRWASIAAFALLAGLAAVAVSWSLRRAAGAGAPASAAAPRTFPFDPANPPPAEESERRLAESPEDLVAGAALVLRLARDGRTEEASIALGRMRQVPGQEGEPLVDYAEGRIASVLGEDQRALVFYTRARDRALADGRAELLGTIRTSRAATLSKLGQRPASLAELEAARADSERIGDPRTLYRTLNGLALEHLQRGEMDQGAADLEAALVAAETAGIEPIVTLENLAVLRAIQGRPDLGEPLARRLLEHYRKAGRANDVGEVSRNLALMLRDLGRPEEASELLGRALELLRESHHGNDVADALQAQGVVALEDGRLELLGPIVAELEATAKTSLKWLPLGYAHWLRARQAALAGDLASAREGFAEARRLILAGGDRDRSALLELAWAEAEAAAGDTAAARRVVADALGALDDPAGTEAAFFAETLLARLDARAGDAAAARARLQALGEVTATSPSLRRRLAYLGARAALAAAEGRDGPARDDLGTAIELTRRSGRRLAELEARLELARLERAAGAGRESALALEREARALGYLALADRARQVSGTG